MFGALVLSGGMLVSPVSADAEPVDPTAKQKDKKSSSKPKPAAENTGVTVIHTHI